MPPSAELASSSAARSARSGAQGLADSLARWPAFPDSPDALTRSGERYQLIIISNVHRDGFAASNRSLRGDFAAIITAEDVSEYEAAENHFRALAATLSELGVERAELPHVAQSLFNDHVPAKREGHRSVWINRRHDRPGGAPRPSPQNSGATTWRSTRWVSSPRPWIELSRRL